MGTCVRDLGGLGLRPLPPRLDARDAVGASTAALELDHGLADALELTLIYLDKPARYERAALRWHQRLTQDARLSLDDSLAALSLIAALRRRRAQGGTCPREPSSA